jgi:hypothetical protein
MKKTVNHPMPENLSSIDENPLMLWITQYGRTLMYVLIGLILAGILIYRFFSVHEEKQEAEYWTAEKEFRLLAKPVESNEGPAINEDALAQLRAVLERHPALQAKYDALIAQTLLDHGNTKDAMPFANSAIDRTLSENQPFYSEFAKTSLLISDKQYDAALKSSLALQQKMQELKEKSEKSGDRHFGDTLFALNFLRIGMLQQQLGLKIDELNTWQEWKKLARTSGFEQQQILFSDGRVSLVDYINLREAQLK